MKIAVSGKGGVGKTTFASFLIKALALEGKRVLAIDADPDANLAQALGLTDISGIVPISEMKKLVEERTGAVPGTMGGFFRLNPTVNDLPDKLSIDAGGVKLMVMGSVKTGGGGCVCPESVLLKQLLRHIVIARDEVVVMDMEAGLEHLGRGTAMGVDRLVVVVEPGSRSIETAMHIKKLAADLGMTNIVLVGNKIRSPEDQEFLQARLSGFRFLGFLPYRTAIIEADLDGAAPYETDSESLEAVREMLVKEMEVYATENS
jgi:CO dehydrogenase maturation factor